MRFDRETLAAKLGLPVSALICYAKRKFETVRRARLAARVRGRQRGVALHVYRCRVCSHFHLTSVPGQPT